MHKKLIFLLLLFIATLSGTAQHSPMNPALIERLKQQIKSNAQSTHSISCDFNQEKTMSLISEKLISKGRFMFRKEKNLRWEYTEPFSYVIVIANDEISIRDEENVSHFNISSNKVFLEINRIILGSVRGTLLQDEKNFRTSYYESPKAYIARLVPVKETLRASLSEVTIHFNHNNFSVDQVDMVEPGGDITRIFFSGKSFNKPIPDEKFVVH
jgi:outer membrane lipoprotein-sorting protein